MEKLKNEFQLKFNNEDKEWIISKVKDKLTENHKDPENSSGVMSKNRTD